MRKLLIAAALLATSVACGDTLYSRTTETGFRYNPAAAGTTTPADPARIAFDDVPIPVDRLGGDNKVEVTRITVGIRRLANAPATDVMLYYSTLTTDVTAPDTNLDLPATQFAIASLAANGASSTTQLVTIGNGVDPLFTADLNETLFSGFGTFAIGVGFSNANNNNGWRITSGADANANVFWLYDPGHTSQANDEGAYFFNNDNPPNPPASFYITVEGTPVPEPSMLGCMAMASFALLRRR
ncbi:MAG: PEP-CTERM sorting domain-containing protein [Phycisphaerales bacterium]|nr:PEP-CTERM sorting domain-containing protein [Phycisphaerales bacterium]